MDALRSRLRRLRRSEDGAELIEMAIITPLLLLIIAGIFDFGFLFRSWEAVTNAAREGARVGVLPAYGCADGGPAEDRVIAYLTASGIDEPPAGNIVPAPVTFATPAGSLTACQVDVTVTQSLPSLTFIIPFFGGSLTSVDLFASSVMRSETQAIPGP
jgi:Flp pilus assembly protein TadG